MPPPGVPDWVFPGAVVTQMPGGPRFAIGTLDLGNDLREMTVFLQRVIDGNPPSLSNDNDFRDIPLGDLISNWHHTGEYLHPTQAQITEVTTGPQTTINHHVPLGSILCMTGGTIGPNMYVVTGHDGNGYSIVAPLESGRAPATRPTAPTISTGPSAFEQLSQMASAIAGGMGLGMIAGPFLPTSQPQVQVNEYYRWETPNHDGEPMIMLLFVERVENNTVYATVAMSELEEVISLDVFQANLTENRARHLSYERTFNEPDGENEEPFIPGMILRDPQDREVFLIARNHDATWVVRAAHDLRGLPQHYLATCQFWANLDDAPWMAEAADDNPWMAEDHSPPYESPRPRAVEVGDLAGVTSPPMTLRIGDRWHFDSPNEGIWTIQRIEPNPQSDGDSYQYRFRSDEGQVMTTPGSWVLTNGRRISPPDPRFTGDPIEPRQLWEIPTNVTRQRASRWRVTKVAVQASVRMVSLVPEGGGAPIYWPEVRLRAQGRFLSDGLVRRTAFERLLGEDDDVG